MKNCIRTVIFVSVMICAEEIMALSCLLPSGLKNPVVVPFSHLADEFTVGTDIKLKIIAVGGSVSYNCASGRLKMFPQCTFGIKFDDGWLATGNTIDWCASAWMFIDNIRPGPEYCRDQGPYPPPECEGQSPILLDLDGNQIHLSAGPANFDIDADGDLEGMTWVAPNALDAFLYLDRNGNGIVDDGSELFGTATKLINGELAENGYAALAEFDLPENGGIEDGVINDADSIYSDLKVWIDVNADGHFEQHEALSTTEAGVVAIGLDYKELPRTDPHGNQFRYNGRAWIEKDGEVQEIWTTDVFFNVLSE